MTHPSSLLVRFFGLHSIKMYGNEFTFIVMKNIFPKTIQLNEKYDIKGSFISRNADLKMPGKLSTCCYCHETFIEGSNEKCSEVIGVHEAIITLKDNDMINKIR
jgi:1-phosphatidylinositol-4-phosphate 5-kinase